jgi:cation:H+ antiporter
VPVALDILVFIVGAAVSLSTSYLLVTRLERIGERLGISEALLGLLAALAADAPEITSAVTAMVLNQRTVGAGVIIGSNVFNLAALLGLGAVVAGSIALHRRVVLLGGAIGIWTAVVCLLTVLGAVPPGAGLAAAGVVMLPYALLLGAGRTGLAKLPLTRRWAAWLAVAIAEEEQELKEVIHPRKGHATDVLAATAALVVVLAASVVMERAGSQLGSRFAIPQILTGGVLLAAVTSLPNAVSAVYLAARGRGAAMLSTTLNSNALNITAGLLLPGTVTGLGTPSAQSDLIAVWNLGLTAIALAYAYRDAGVRRSTGVIVISGYLVFLVSLFTAARSASPGPGLTVVPLGGVVVASVVGLARRPGRRGMRR